MQNVLEMVLLGESAARKITHSLTLVESVRQTAVNAQIVQFFK